MYTAYTHMHAHAHTDTHTSHYNELLEVSTIKGSDSSVILQRTKFIMMKCVLHAHSIHAHTHLCTPTHMCMHTHTRHIFGAAVEFYIHSRCSHNNGAFVDKPILHLLLSTTLADWQINLPLKKLQNLGCNHSNKGWNWHQNIEWTFFVAWWKTTFRVSSTKEFQSSCFLLYAIHWQKSMLGLS